MTQCPACGARGIGRVGVGQYYCWECCVEFAVTKAGVQIFEVGADGELLAADDSSDAPEVGLQG